MSKFQLKPQEGATPENYMLEDEKTALHIQNENIDLSSYKTSKFCLKCTNVDGYLAASRDGWLELDAEKAEWKAYWKTGKDSGSFALQVMGKLYKDYYVGHKTGGILAGVYYWWTGSDWLELLSGGRLINNKLDDRSLAKHTNGYFYWINRTEATYPEYTVLKFEKVTG